MSDTGPDWEMRCDEPYIKGLWWTWMPADNAWCTITRADGIKWMRWVWRNGEMKFAAGENGTNPKKNLPRFSFGQPKLTWSDWDANSGSQRHGWLARWRSWSDGRVGEWAELHSPTLHLHHNSFSNPSVASPTLQAPHLCHLVSHPCPAVGGEHLTTCIMESPPIYF